MKPESNSNLCNEAIWVSEFQEIRPVAGLKSTYNMLVRKIESGSDQPRRERPAYGYARKAGVLRGG